MKRCINVVLALIITMTLTSCASTEERWQEQYDLGIRYLAEGNYEEAIIAFTAAIEIDPNQALAYVGRGDAYIGFGETEENLAVAQADYEQAIEMDETLVEAYLGLADVYVQHGDMEKALEVLRQSLEHSGEDSRISEKIMAIEAEVEASKPWGYNDFNEFTPEQQQYVETLVGLVRQNERDSAWDLLKDIKEKLNTEHNVSFAFREYRIDMGPIYKYDICGGRIEIHPKEGTGFYCSYSDWEGNFDERYGVGECENWDWNGPFQDYARYNGMHNSPYEYIQIATRSGMMRNGLLDGEVEEHIKRTKIRDSASSADDEEETYLDHYDMGVGGRDVDQELLCSAFGGFRPDDIESWDWSINRSVYVE